MDKTIDKKINKIKIKKPDPESYMPNINPILDLIKFEGKRKGKEIERKNKRKEKVWENKK